MPLQTSVGQLLVNDALPEDLRDYTRVLDKKGVEKLFTELARRYPDRYKDVYNRLQDLGGSFSSAKGMSVSLRHLVPSPARKQLLDKLKQENLKDLTDETLTDQERDKRVIDRTAQYYDQLKDLMLKDAQESGNPLAVQVTSGGRGNPEQLNSITGADLLVLDHKGNVVPTPIYNGYADGLDPAEFFAAGFGTRSGQIAVKFGVGEAGYFSKQLSLAAHRASVTDEAPKTYRLPVGLPVEVEDQDSDGSVLARDAGPYKAGTELTPRVLADLKEKGVKRLLVHSPLTSYTEDGGLDRLSAGRRERQGLAEIGDNIGIQSAQAVGEPLSQGLLSAKHTAGAGKGRHASGFAAINKLFQAPESYAEAAPLAPHDGVVKSVEPAPQGGHYVTIDNTKLYVHPDHEITIKPGQKLEQGDDLTSSMPHPSDLVHYRGVGAARRDFLTYAQKVMKENGLKVNRRNLEPIVAGMINFVQVSDPDGVGDHIVDDVVQHGRIVSQYTPREGTQRLPVRKAIGRYLEEPVLHYTPGTRITSRMAKDLEEFDIQDLDTHDQEPGFRPYFERLMTASSHDPDWRTRMGGFYIGRSLTQAVHRGAESDPRSTSFIPALAEGVGFAQNQKQTGRY